MTLASLWSTIQNSILSSPRQAPSTVAISADHTDRTAQLSGALEANKDYFLVRVNQLFLRSDRKWLTEIDPLAFVVSEFNYAKKAQVAPFVVGPGMLAQFGQQLPQGMVFTNTTAAGVHPYRGGALSLTVVLCQVPVSAMGKKLLGLIEQASRAFNPVAGLSTALQIGGLILDGIDGVLGLNDTKPLAGWRFTVDPQAGDTLGPGYYVLSETSGLRAEQLWVKNDALHIGNDLNSAQPYTGGDYVLYSVLRTPGGERNDIEMLPFYELYERAVAEAQSDKPGAWDNAKGVLIALLNAVAVSPDLTKAHAAELSTQFIADVKAARERAGLLERSAADDELQDARALAAGIAAL